MNVWLYICQEQAKRRIETTYRTYLLPFTRCNRVLALKDSIFTLWNTRVIDSTLTFAVLAEDFCIDFIISTDHFFLLRVSVFLAAGVFSESELLVDGVNMSLSASLSAGTNNVETGH